MNQRILVHLLTYVRYVERFDAPPGITQQGIANALGARRSHVTVALQALEQQRLVEDRIARIAGGTRRKKAYALTPLGYARALETQSWMESLVRAVPQLSPAVPVLATPMG